MNFTIGSLSQTTLASGATATLGVQPNAGLAVGVYHETLNITGRNGVNSNVEVNFEVIPMSSYKITASQSTLTFANQTPDYTPPVPQTVTINNTGTREVTISPPTSAK